MTLPQPDTTPDAPVVSVLALMLGAPWSAVDPELDRPDLIHAATAGHIMAANPDPGVGEPHLAAPCGARVRILAKDGYPVGWPPRVSTLPAGIERCRDCWEATGRKRPHPDWKAPRATT